MRNKLDGVNNLAIAATECSRPKEGGLRHRKMVPKISVESTHNIKSEHGQISPSSETRDWSFKDKLRDFNGDSGLENPTVLIEDPLSTIESTTICETSFLNDDRVALPDSTFQYSSTDDYLNQKADISLSSDEEDVKVTGSFNSRNLYKQVATDDYDETNEESILLPDGELRKINEGNREVDIKISTEEKSLNIALQVFFPFMIAGLGTVAAGLLLDIVQVELLVDFKVIKNSSKTFFYIENFPTYLQ